MDIKEDGNIDLDLCEEELKDSSNKTIYVVHLSGNPNRARKVKYLKENYNINNIEDCAHF